jgi:hypothetical protein
LADVESIYKYRSRVARCESFALSLWNDNRLAIDTVMVINELGNDDVGESVIDEPLLEVSRPLERASGVVSRAPIDYMPRPSFPY